MKNGNFNKVITHVNVDLDAGCSAGFGMRYYGIETVDFVPANYTSTKRGELRVDLFGGIKGNRDSSGKVGSAFAKLVSESRQDVRSKLAAFAQYVDVEDSQCCPVSHLLPKSGSKGTLKASGFAQMFDRLRRAGWSDHELVGLCSDILHGMFKGEAKNWYEDVGRLYPLEQMKDKRVFRHLVANLKSNDPIAELAPEASEAVDAILAAGDIRTAFAALVQVGYSVAQLKQLASDHVKGQRIFSREIGEAKRIASAILHKQNSPVVLVREPDSDLVVRTLLHNSNVQAVVYLHGNNLGIVARPQIRGVLYDAVEAMVSRYARSEIRKGQWFRHPDDRLLCRGSRKAPMKTRSRIDARGLRAELERVAMNHMLECAQQAA